MTQEEMVLKHLKEIGPLTRRKADEFYGITELPARVFYLKAAGHRIMSTDRTVINRFGKKTRITEYSLVEGDEK